MTETETIAAICEAVAEVERALRDPTTWRIPTEAETVALISESVAEVEREIAASLARFGTLEAAREKAKQTA